MTTVVSGCVHCHQIVFRGADDVPWRTLRGYAACAQNDGPHQAPAVTPTALTPRPATGGRAPGSAR
jgi:hypothetical protein